MILIAYSGGLDSTVLLHQCLEQYPREQLRAIHINHDLYPESNAWQAHCEKTCAFYSIPLITIKLAEKPPAGVSIEAWARDHRRRIFLEHIQPNETLMTAQHADDQAETVLLQLLRGSGPKGLAAMPPNTECGEGRHVRPLLHLSKDAILEYAQRHALIWITDHSNFNTQFDRNFLREEIIPDLKKRWPALDQTLSRSANHCAQQEALLEELIKPLYQNTLGSKPGTLSIRALLKHSLLIQRAIVRYWIDFHDFQMMNHKKFEKIFEDLIPARPDAQPEIVWAQACIRRYRDDLYLLKSDTPRPIGPRLRKQDYQAQGIPPWERELS